jgi:uncharacterized RDD family membrane protein YckC
MNPIVAAALARIDRAHKPQTTPSRPITQRVGKSANVAHKRTKANKKTGKATNSGESFVPVAKAPAKSGVPAMPKARSAAAVISTAKESSQASKPVPPKSIAHHTGPTPSNLIAESERTPSKPVVADHHQAPPKLITDDSGRTPSKLIVPDSQAAPPKVMAPESQTALAVESEHNLVVVQATAVKPELVSDKPKPKRLIRDDDPALCYLEALSASVKASTDPAHRAPIISRLAAGLVDLIAVAFLSSPFAAILELQNLDWRDPGVILLMGVIAAVVMFVYLTISTAFTGKTLGLKIVSLRAIDVRTGLIPTGAQSAGRALLSVLSLATLGIGFVYALFDDERKTAYDRLSRTAVIRD